MFSKAFKLFRKDLHAIPLGVKLIVFVIFVRGIGWGFVDPFWALYLNQFSDHYALIGALTSLLSLSALLTIILMMRLLDRMREAVVIQDGEVVYLFVVLAYFLAGLFHNMPLLILALFFNGVAQTLVVVGTESYIRKHNGKGLAGPFGYYIALDYLGWVIGMLIAAFTIQYYNFNLMFLFVLPSIFISFIILPRIHERGVRSLLRGFKKYFKGRQDIVKVCDDCKTLNPKMIFFLIIAFFDGAIKMFTLVFIPLLGISLNLDLRSIALLMAVMYLPFVFSFFFSELSDRLQKMNVIATGLFIGAVSFISLYFIVYKALIVVMAAMISLSMAIVRPAYNGMITRLTPRRMMGEVTGLNNLFERFGRILGPIVAGLTADAYGLQTAFLFMAVIAFGLGMMAMVLRGYDSITSPPDIKCVC